MGDTDQLSGLKSMDSSGEVIQRVKGLLFEKQVQISGTHLKLWGVLL